MKSLHLRLTLWFSVSLFVTVLVMMGYAYWHLDYELRREKWERSHPTHPDWVLHASFTDAEVHDILDELAEVWLIIGLPLVAIAGVSGYLIARRSVRPVQQINEQLNQLDIKTLSTRLCAPDADPHIQKLVEHFNELLGRLATSFNHLQEYTAQVAHELRTPLQLMRLQIESNAADMAPELAESLQEELARLSNYVETALTIARAEQGRIELKTGPAALNPFLNDALEPFARLALSEQRQLLWHCPEEIVVQTDSNILKQILVNLLANALKHGGGGIYLRVRSHGSSVSLLVGNQPAYTVAAARNGLGIGLRLVRALAQLMPGTRVTMRHRRFFWVQLRMPTTPILDSRCESEIS